MNPFLFAELLDREWSLHHGSEGIQLGEFALQSWAKRRWLDVAAIA